MFRFALALLVSLSVLLTPGCALLHPSPATATAVLDAGCAVVGIADPNGGPAIATVCESLAPVVGPIVSDLLKARGAYGYAGAPRYVVLTQRGKVVGYARWDVADAIQVELDKP